MSVVSGNAPESIAGLEITFGNHIAQRGLGSLLVRVDAFTDTNPNPRLLWTFHGLAFSFLRGDSPGAGLRQALLLLFRRGAKLV